VGEEEKVEHRQKTVRDKEKNRRDERRGEERTYAGVSAPSMIVVMGVQAGRLYLIRNFCTARQKS
jgi:hypothetical protein